MISEFGYGLIRRLRATPSHRAFGTAVVIVALGGCAATPAPEAGPDERVEPASLVLRGGKIATVDKELGEVEAVAVRGATIVAVGTNDEIAAYVGPETNVIELEGRRAVPGFIEGHGHYLSLGRAKQVLDLNDVRNWSEVVSMVAAAAKNAAPGEWIFGRGWHQEKWDRVPDDAVEGVPRNDTLNVVSRDNPVLLGHASGHAAFANDAALAAAGIDADTPNPPGGTIVRAKNGKATGLLRETAQRLVQPAVKAWQAKRTPEETDRIRREQVALAGQEALEHGVTSFHDAGTSFDDIDFLKGLEEEGALPIRLYVMVRYASVEEMDARLPDYYMPADGDDYLTVRSIKKQIDGALGAHGAWLLEPYTDLKDTTGLVLDPVEEIEGTAGVAIKHGYQVNTHAIGDRANRETLDIYQRAFEAAGVDSKALRWRIEHAQHINPVDVPRFGQLGVIAAVQGIHCTSDGPWIPSRLGDARTKETSYPWRDLIATGAVIGNGTDVPVERIDALASYTSSVTRITKDGTAFFPEQAMTRMEALESYTINNAFAAFEEDIKGSLTPGKLADIVVLSKDILTAPEAELPDTEVDMTILGGTVRYQREGS